VRGPSGEEDRVALRDAVRRFAAERIAPFAHEWDEAGGFPRSLYREAADLGLLGLGYAEAFGGTPADLATRLAVAETVAHAGTSGGVLASLFSHNIALPPILALGTPALRRELVPPVLRGERIAALAISEPGAGSDVASLRTAARRDGAHWILDGEKAYITSGLRADLITVAARTGGPGAAGISLFAVDADTPGLTRTPLAKMGWWCSDTALLRFDACRVPGERLLGDEGAGFAAIMRNFNGERLLMSAAALGFAEVCFDEALAWARERKTFGQPLVERQVIRHQLADLRMHIEATRAWVEALARRHDAGETGAPWVAEVCLLKNQATQTMQRAADRAVQMLGAMGYMRGTVCERVYREAKVMMIGGGAEEIMKELAARQLGF
jgi:acyl-CoA dehydrogenase